MANFYVVVVVASSSRIDVFGAFVFFTFSFSFEIRFHFGVQRFFFGSLILYVKNGSGVNEPKEIDKFNFMFWVRVCV